MRVGVGLPIILFVVVAGFQHAISASLESDESNESSEEREFSESSTTPQPNESQFAAAHVEGKYGVNQSDLHLQIEAIHSPFDTLSDDMRTTHMDGKQEALANNTEKGSDEESEEIKYIGKEDYDDGETEAQSHTTGENTGSDESVDTDSQEITSPQKTDHSEQAEDHVKSADDVPEEESVEYS